MALYKYFQPASTSGSRRDGDSPPPPKRQRVQSDSPVPESDNEDDEMTLSDSLSSRNESDLESVRSASTSSSASSKQSRRFNPDWLGGRQHWLEYVRGRGMFCLLCRKYNKRPFNNDTWNSEPCARLRLQSVTSHERSAAHLDCIKLEAAAASTPKVAEAFNPPVPAQGMEQAFLCLYFLTKQRIAHTTNYEPLLDLAGFLGVDIKSKISIARNATYTSDKTIQEMVYVISEIIEREILNEMRESHHFALMLDETTDCTVTEQLALHGRYIHASTGELKSHYLKVIDLLHDDPVRPDSAEQDLSVAVSAGAENITSRVCAFTEQAKLDMTRLRGIGTDGAATMAGCNTGVVVRLKSITPSAIGVHCAAHRLNLASSQAGDSVRYVKQFKSVLRQLFDFFDNSAVRMAGLDAIKSLLQQKGRLEAPSSTRWLSVERCVNKLMACFASIVVSLEREGTERSDAKAIGLHRLVTEYRFVCTMLLMCDALPHVSRLSKCFQITDCDYSIIPRMQSCTIKSLEQLKTTDGVNLDKLQEFLDNLQQAGIEIKKPAHLAESYFHDNIRVPFLTTLVANIQNRFEDKSVLAAFDIFDPKKLPGDSASDSESLAAAEKYGKTAITTLADQFEGVVASEEECLEEWIGYRQFLRGSVESGHLTKHREVIKDLCSNTTTASLFPNMSKFAQICRVVPIHTADVERTFSQLKLIKTRIRNRMNEKTLDALLRIAVEGPSIEQFPVADAVQLWASKRNRRLL